MSSETHTESSTCVCPACRAEVPFDLPHQLVDDCMAGNVVVFAGAGTSTESPLVFSHTLYEDVCADADIPPESPLPTFPQAMQVYEDKFGRPKLLQKIKERLDYMKSFPELDHLASEFHQELSSVFPIRNIFTTNWDDYFERECAATPFVTEKDWGFWRNKDRKVFKLHGSVASPGSIVATERDYAACYRRLDRGLVGATLKTMLATKTVVFIGYSFGDSDFNAIYRTLFRRMKEVLPRAYVVTLDATDPPPPMESLHVIRTGAVHFVRTLKQHLPEDEFLPDERFAAVPIYLKIAREVHHATLRKRPIQDYPETAHCAAYQDGLIHAFEHQLANRRAGDYAHRCHVVGWIEMYEDFYSERIRARRYYDAAYVQGYLNGLIFALCDDEVRKELPFQFVFGHKGSLESWEEYEDVADRAASLHKSAFAQAKRIAQRHPPGTVVHHPPMLLPAPQGSH